MNISAEHPSFTIREIELVSKTRFSGGNRVTLIWKDRESFQQIFDAVLKAREFICLVFYIFRNDETGSELAVILKQKASEGVRVCVLYDHFGSFGTPRSFWQDLRRAGVQVRASRPFSWTMPFHYVHRDHRKLIIIDGGVAFTGGLNIANEYRGYHWARRRAGWRDTGIFLEGPVARDLFLEFEKSWHAAGGKEPPVAKDVPPFPDGLPVLPIFASSAKGRRRMRKLLYFSINAARESICLTTAYFTPSRRMIHVLEAAVHRGVHVSLLLPGQSDVSAPYYAGRRFFTKLLTAGVEIHEYQGEILHAKTSVFDRQWSIIGSANLDFQSLRRNDEGNVGIVDRQFGMHMADIFADDLTRSRQVTPEAWSKRPPAQKIKEFIFALFRRRL